MQTGALEAATWIKGVSFDEQGYNVRSITEKEDLLKAFLLRHEVFCRELGWVPAHPDGLEVDRYDKRAVGIGVFNASGELEAYARLVLTGGPFMIEKEFYSLVCPSHRIRHGRDTAEISRLCIAKGARKHVVSRGYGCHSLSVLLMKGIYQWCMKNGVRYLYAETERTVYCLARRKGFPFMPIGEPRRMPDGVVAVAVLLDWEEFLAENRESMPMLLAWFDRTREASGNRRSRRHGRGSRLPAFA